MYDHIFYKQVQISRSDIRPHIKWAVSLVILHMVTSIFLQGLCGYIWVNILTLSPQRGIITGGGKDPQESQDDYTTTFHVMLAPKSLQQLAIQNVFKHKNVLPWKCLPQKLKTYLGLTESD